MESARSTCCLFVGFYAWSVGIIALINKGLRHQYPVHRGSHSGAIVISAEITTSEKPVGTIDSRMQKTLAKLAEMQGAKFYFVRTLKMKQRANTKIAKGGWKIEVVQLAA